MSDKDLNILPALTFLQRHNIHDVKFKKVATWSKEDRRYRWFRVYWETHFTDKVAWSHNFISIGFDFKKLFSYQVNSFYEKRVTFFGLAIHRKKSVSGRFA